MEGLRHKFSNGSHNDMDCIMTHHMLQARTSKKKRETVNYAARDLEEEPEEGDRQQQVIESWEEQESEARLGNCLQPDGAEETVIPR